MRIRPARPGWLASGSTKLAVLSLFIVLVGMIRLHLTRTSGAVSVIVAAALTVAAVAWLLGAARRLAHALPFLQVTAYLSSFVDWGRGAQPDVDAS